MGPPQSISPLGWLIPWETPTSYRRPESQGPREDQAKPFMLQMRETEAQRFSKEISGSDKARPKLSNYAASGPAAPQGLLPRKASPLLHMRCTLPSLPPQKTVREEKLAASQPQKAHEGGKLFPQ